MIKNENYKTIEDIEEENRKLAEEKQKKEEEEKKKQQEYFEKNKKAIARDKTISKLKDLVLCVIVAAILCFLIIRFAFFKAVIPSSSMVPTLNEGDQVFVTRIYNTEKIKRGDIIVFKSKELNDTLVKRVVGLPGEVVEIDKGMVSVNGKELEEDYVINSDNSSKRDGKYYVPDDSYFFLGDNRPVSDDAGLWKNPFISKDDIIGKAQIRVYPFNDMGFVNK